MRYKLDYKKDFKSSLLFWLDRFVKYKLTSLSNRQVSDNKKLSTIIAKLNKGSNSIDELKDLCKNARNIGLIGINTYINPLYNFYNYIINFDFKSLKEIDEEIISEFLASQTGSLSDATKKNYRMTMVAFFGFLDKQNEESNGNAYIFRIELKNWGGLKSGMQNKLPSYMQDEELKRFLKAIDETPFKEYAKYKNRLLIKIILYSGMRVSEALGLHVKDITKEDGYFIFMIRGKGNKPRVAMIKEKFIQKDFDEWMSKRDHSISLLFYSRTKKPLTQPYVSYIMDKILSHAGIRKDKNGAHMLRHTFATRLYQKNRDLVLVQEALGHASLDTSRIYTHFDKERLKKATSAIED
ncbi:tyrosine-type recombinase/integrase [Sulfurospirillum sp. 1307]|jgi:integrase/recombinase XerD